MILDKRIRIYGNTEHRDGIRNENAQSQTFGNQVRKRYPDLLIMHIKNEGKKTKAQADFDRSRGMLTGASDFIILGNPTFCLEMKNTDHTQSTISKQQIEFLVNASEQGCFACVALGWEAALSAVEDWLIVANKNILL